ncbi:MAG TPA: two-component regulator propeller domain-containing protein, partial [Kofleriaceae bacterium]|nr:two-component regulator propeller domain-containing protein [Kofleriaceae bacterium]
MVRHAFYVLLSIALAGGTARAQGAQASFKTVERLAPPLGCDRVGVEDGLPHTNVTAIAQDQLGFVWFGTGGGGLGRYDGLQMYVYRPKANDPTSLSSGFITSLAVGGDGALWVGTADAGVSRWDPKTNAFTRFDKDKLGSERVTAIARDRKDRMWFAIEGNGLVRFDPSTGELTPYDDKPLDVGITSLSADAKGNLWLGTASPRVIRWNPDDGSNQVFDLAPGNQAFADMPVSAVLAASTGKVFAGTKGAGLFELDPGTGKIVARRHSPTDPATLTADEVSVLFEDKQHVVW